MNEINIISEDKLAHYKKGTYSGSHKGMRYFISGKTTEVETLFISLCVWPEPYCSTATPEEEKEYFQFEFSDEGLCALEEKLNHIYLEKLDFWNSKEKIQHNQSHYGIYYNNVMMALFMCKCQEKKRSYSSAL